MKANKTMSNFHIIKCLVFMSIIWNFVLPADATLKLINVIFRHGDRTLQAAESYPKDPNSNYNFDSQGNGILTKSGELRQYNLGKFLRSTYNDFLGSNYVSGSVEARSTDFNRTKESLKQVLKALYPEISVPITVTPLLKDSLFFPQICPRYVIEYRKAKGKPDVKEELAKLKGFRKNLTQWTGKTIKKSLDMYIIYSTLETEKYMNLTLPSWTTGVFPNGDLLDGVALEYKIMNYDDKMKRRSGGMLVRKFAEDMMSVRSGTMDKNRKINLYSGHDINIVAVLKALGVYYPHFPKFSSTVILELHFIEEDFFVKVSYYLGIPAEIKELKIPGCKTLCPLDQFLALMKNVIPTGLDLLCSKIRDVNSADDNNSKEFMNLTNFQKNYL